MKKIKKLLAWLIICVVAIIWYVRDVIKKEGRLSLPFKKDKNGRNIKGR